MPPCDVHRIICSAAPGFMIYKKTGLPGVHAFEKKNKNKESEDKNRCQMSSTEILLSRVFSFNSEEEWGLVLKRSLAMYPQLLLLHTSGTGSSNGHIGKGLRNMYCSHHFLNFYSIYIATSHSLCLLSACIPYYYVCPRPPIFTQKFNLQNQLSGTEWKLDPTLVFGV